MTKSRRKSNDKTPLSLPPVGSSAGQPADGELMNELVAATGRNDKVMADRLLFDLKARHEPLVMNVLKAENVPAHDRDAVSGRVWETIDRVARKPSGSKGFWDPGRGFGGGCPFVPFLKDVCSSRARDYHDTMKTARRRRRRVEEAASTFGDEWHIHGGSAVKAAFPKKRGGNLKHTEPPAAWNVVAAGRTMLATAMTDLSERNRRALELHAEGMSNEEIAAVMGMSAATVSRDLTAARKSIRRLAEAAAAR
jgi:RNA polymerase sigma factor (sigma-70 family)